MGDQDDGDTRDTGVNGHGYSPALRDAEREIAAVKARVDGFSSMGRGELEKMMAAGNALLANAQRTTDESDKAARKALECFAACYVMSRALEYPRGEIDALSTAALCYRQLRRPEVALTMWNACIDLSARHDDRQGHAHALGNAGLAMRALGRLDDAAMMQRKSTRVALECGDGECAVRGYINLANLQLARACPAAHSAATASASEGKTAESSAAALEKETDFRLDAQVQLRTALELLDQRRGAAARPAGVGPAKQPADGLAEQAADRLADADSQGADAQEQTGGQRDVGPTALLPAALQLELNVCLRLGALLELVESEREMSIGEAVHGAEIVALYRRALQVAALLAACAGEEGGTPDEQQQHEHHSRLVAALTHKLSVRRGR
jgi:tetratricopeptide (TPR) repeat protein